MDRWRFVVAFVGVFSGARAHGMQGGAGKEVPTSIILAAMQDQFRASGQFKSGSGVESPFRTRTARAVALSDAERYSRETLCVSGKADIARKVIPLAELYVALQRPGCR
jgi:hypothetical protein